MLHFIRAPLIAAFLVRALDTDKLQGVPEARMRKSASSRCFTLDMTPALFGFIRSPYAYTMPHPSLVIPEYWLERYLFPSCNVFAI